MPETSPIALRTAAITDIGRVRRQNEDRFLCSDEASFYAVADGIGGLPGGAAAAQACVDSLRDHLTELEAVEASADLVPILQAANDHVFNLGMRLSPYLGMGCTLVCATIKAGQLHLAHVGDSRCYLLREGRAIMLTLDHSVANEYVRTGSEPPIDYSPAQLGALTRCIGQPDTPQIDVAQEPLQSGDRILLASDGVYRVIADEEFPDLLGGDRPLSERLSDLVKLVNERGAPDNATAVLIVVD